MKMRHRKGRIPSEEQRDLMRAKRGYAVAIIFRRAVLAIEAAMPGLEQALRTSLMRSDKRYGPAPRKRWW